MEQGQIFLTENANLLGLHCDILDIFKHFRFRQKNCETEMGYALFLVNVVIWRIILDY